eukprot:CAMPEP_0174722552 /NCGR_PEP_ID=MMETSP1094-20130205/38739_1 /TAXON_ID=156173 /ORGANISM="Chrysochromulina brevifilum, Strain UTEX LB 985" /LENGTH=31 /DNA_ID= /DNA_START= /DNA_END= /DNA_ORIENTATION=
MSPLLPPSMLAICWLHAGMHADQPFLLGDAE